MNRRRAAPVMMCALSAGLSIALLFGPSAVTARNVDEQTRAYALTVIAGISGLAVNSDRTRSARAPDDRPATCAPVLRGAAGWLCVVLESGANPSQAWLAIRPGGTVTRVVYRSSEPIG